MTYIARPPAGTQSVSPIAARTSHAWRPLQPPDGDPPPNQRRGLRAPRPRARRQPRLLRQTHGHANPSSTSPRGRQPESIWHRDRPESLPILRLNTRIGGPDSTPTTAFTARDAAALGQRESRRPRWLPYTPKHECSSDPVDDVHLASRHEQDSPRTFALTRRGGEAAARRIQLGRRRSGRLLRRPRRCSRATSAGSQQAGWPFVS
jgi:hypothetical protein